MADPARKHNPDIQSETRPNLHVINGGGESTPERGNLHEAETSTAEDLNNQEQKFGVIQGGGESTPERGNLSAVSNIDNAKEKEQDGSQWMYAPSREGSRKERFQGTMKALKRKGPLGMIIGLLVGGGGFFTVLVAPGVGIVQMKEVLMSDLNDQVAAMDIRTSHVLRAKLKSLKAGGAICTQSVKVRCKFTTMSKRQISKFKNAGFDVKTETTKPFGRQRIVSMTAPDGSKINDPADLNRLARTNPAVGSALRATFNPRFAGMSDKVANSRFARLFVDKASHVNGDTDEERDKSMTESTKGKAANRTPDGKLKEKDGREYVVDEEGNKVYADGEADPPNSVDKDKFDEIAAKTKADIDDIAKKAAESKPGASAVGGILKSGVKGISALGPLDTACTINNAAMAVGAAAKVTRSIQLVQGAVLIDNMADEIKAGKGTAEKVEWLGDKLTAIDMNETVTDESSLGTSDDVNNVQAQERKNPNFGKNAWDSPGMKTAMYNEAPKLSTRDSQFSIGGGLVGTLEKVMDKIHDTLGGRKNVKKTCQKVQSWWARAAGLVAGIISMAGSFGATTAISIGASVALGFAAPFLKAALADIMAGNVVSGKTKGYDLGNVAFVGTSKLLGDIAQGRGMKPASKSEKKAYDLIAKDVQEQYVALETYEARDTPFDIYNQYSFLGSAIRKINPTILESSTTVSRAVINVPTILGTAFSSVLPHVNAAQEFNEERYSKCNDPTYEDLNIDADVFCNVRYAMTPEELAMDSEANLEWMLNGGHIDGEEGEPKSDEFKDWVKNCVDREAWGTTEEENGSLGEECVDPDLEERNKHFRVYQMDNSINGAMDEDLSAGGDVAEQQDATTGSTDWKNPALGKYQISAPYGRYSSGAPHYGIDMAYSGDFASACSGTIKSIGNNGDSNGRDGSPKTNIITINCNDGTVTKYMHYYYKNLASGIKVGAKVNAGDKLAKTGNQGNSTGTHLHFQVEVGGKTTDPAKFMKKKGVTL